MSKHAEFPGVKLSCTKSTAGRNNFTKWQEFVADHIGPKYGACIIRTNVPYAVRPVEEQDYIPDDLPDDIAFTDANKRELYMKAFCRKKDEEGRLKKESPMFFRDLWSSLSEESRTLIRAEPGYSGAGGWGTGEDPNELWGTHFTLENAGEGAAMERVNLLMKLKTLEQLKQTPGTSVAEFLRDYLELVASAEEAGMPVDDEEMKAVKFLYKAISEQLGQWEQHRADTFSLGVVAISLLEECSRGFPLQTKSFHLFRPYLRED